MRSVLSPVLYFWRNPGRTMPIALVIVLAVVLVASVTSIIHSVDLTIFTLYGYNRDLTGLTPRNSLEITQQQIAPVRKLPQLGALYRTHSYQIFIKTIFGKMPFPVFGLPAAGQKLILQRTGLSLAAGHMPRSGQPEAVISEAVARNIGAHIGSVILQPDSRDAYAPIPVKLVGLLRGPCWLGLTSRKLVDAWSPLTFSGYLAFSRIPSQPMQRSLDNAIYQSVNHGQVRVWRFSGLVRETRSALSNLYLILHIVVALIIFSIAFVCGLLSNIYFSQRLPEVATLAAIGYTRESLLARALGETALFCAAGWLLGSLATFLLLLGLQHFVLSPKGLLINPLDVQALGFTLPLPIVILLFSLGTLWLRLQALDPVSIIERRG